MLAGELYRPDAPEIVSDQAITAKWLARYNSSAGSAPDVMRMILTERLAAMGANVVIRPPFFCDYGYNLRLGDGVFLNFNCVILDVVEVTIGDRTQIGPAVQIYAADHPRDAKTRRAGKRPRSQSDAFGTDEPLRRPRARRVHVRPLSAGGVWEGACS